MANPTSYGAFVPTTNDWDVGRFYQANVNSDEFKELIVKLYQFINNISLSINIRDAGYYTLTEFINGQLFFPNPNLNSGTQQNPVYRQAFRKIINFGSLPNAGTKSVPHDLVFAQPTTYSFTRIYAAASDQTGNNFIPIPYASSTLANNIELRVDNTNVIITTGSNRTNFTLCYVVLEYIKQ